jgi:nicotinamide riboside transporter PnuC
MQGFTWVLTAACLVGLWLNIRRDRRCFHIWIVTNVAWVAVDVRAGLYAQGALFAVYVGMSVWGLRKWKAQTAVIHGEKVERPEPWPDPPKERGLGVPWSYP